MTTTDRLAAFRERARVTTTTDADVATAVNNGRAALRRRRMRRSAIGGGALLTAFTFTVLAGAGITGQAAPASAASILTRAADGDGTGSAQIPEGEFLKVTTKEMVLSYIWDDVKGEVAGGYLYPSTRSVWIPADKSDEWTRVARSSAPSVVFGGAVVEAAASEEVARMSADDWQNGTVRAPGGAFANELGGAPERPIEILESLPRDPQRLLDYIRSHGEDTDGGVLTWIAGQLQSGAVSAELQGSMYRTLALLPSAHVTGDQIDLDGRAGTAIGVENGSGNLNEIIIDEVTGEFIGQRTTQTVDANNIAAGTVIYSTSVSTELVTDAP
jgi:hypothetical protein